MFGKSIKPSCHHHRQKFGGIQIGYSEGEVGEDTGRIQAGYNGVTVPLKNIEKIVHWTRCKNGTMDCLKRNRTMMCIVILFIHWWQ